ncbi:hypothetical protein DEI95_05120 [Curtobacterium sp. MCBD17_008]|nr:hypothetical protein DEI95_05120 [Curtobacterium sp. MCBD17_008]
MTGYTIKPRSARPLSSAEAAQADRIQALVADQLASVRRAAERWRDGSGVASAITAAAALFAAPEILQKAAAWQLRQGGICVGAGIALAVVALILSLYSSVGWPRRADLTNPGALDVWYGREVTRALWSLRLSMLFTLFALVTLSAAGGVLLFRVWLPL